MMIGGVQADGVSFLRDATQLEAEKIAFDQAEVVATLPQKLFVKIDNHIAAIYAKYTRFQAEYTEREAAARAFVAAGYAGTPASWVTSYATSAGKTNAESADIIISQADALHAALEQLAALRMDKYSVLTSPTPQAVHDNIIASANAIAATLG